jgi:GT2 family glycosyltransferase
MTPMRYTVIATSLNQARFIERTICSVLDQGCEPLQFIVVDRGSTDETAQIISLYENELTFLSAPGATKAQAIKAALAEATGQVIAFVEDVILPGALHEMARRMSAPGSPDWFVGQGVELSDDDFELSGIVPVAPPSLAGYLMHDAGLLPLHATFIRRSLLEAAGGFDADLVHAFDYDLCCRLLAAGNRPTLTGVRVAGCRGHAATLTADEALRQGLEFITVARRYASRLTLREQAALWRNCDQRQRIYALAEAELSPDSARQKLWGRLRRHPWWIMDETVRHTLMHGIAHPAPTALARTAA